jgi:hypothetical protein
MTDVSQMALPEWLAQAAGWCAYASGVVSIFGIVFLVIFFSVGGVFGPLNDVAVIIHYTLMLPVVLALYVLLRPYRPGLSLIALLVGLVGILAVIVLQAMLVAGMLPFSQQIKLVIPAFLVALVWFVMTGVMGRAAVQMPGSLPLDVLAGLYVGYPIWAFKLGRWLLSA